MTVATLILPAEQNIRIEPTCRCYLAKTPMKKTIIKTEDLKRALRDRYHQPEWSLFFEVPDGTGANQRRRADAVAMNMYPSRGLEVHGFELKCSRPDWLRELKKPQKAEPIFRYCDRWWVVAAKDVVLEGELPPTWGLLVLNTTNGSLRQVVAAPELKPNALDRPFIAALLRQAGKLDEAEQRAVLAADRSAMQKDYEQRLTSGIERARRDYKELLEQIDEFKTKTGFDIGRRGPDKEFVKAVNLVSRLGVDQTFGYVQSLRNAAERVVTEYDNVVQALE